MLARAIPALICLLGTPATLVSADFQNLPGHGTAQAEKSLFGQDKENQKALDQAQRNATADAMLGGLSRMLGHGQLDPARTGALAKDLVDHGSTFIRNLTTTDAHMEGLTAVVTLQLRVDFAEMKEYLESKGISLTQDFEAKLKFVVLSYTLEGMDADHAHPVVLHEVVQAASQNSSNANYDASSSASSSSQSVEAGRAVVVTPYGAAAAAHGSAAAASSQDASQVSASSNAQASASYFRVTDYADPTKKGMGGNSEVRNLIEGALQKADLQVATIDNPLTGNEAYASEDAFVNQVLAAVRRHPEVKPEDCVAIVINSLTPLPSGPTNPRGHMFSSRVTARFVRSGDGVNLLPSNSVVKTSQSLPSDDEARTQATTLSVMNLTSRLPEYIRKNLQKLQREAGRAAAPPSGIYTIEIQNVQERTILAKTKQWLRQQGFDFKSDSSAGGTVETLTVKLGDRSPEEIKDALDGLPGSLALIAKSDSAAKIRVK